MRRGDRPGGQRARGDGREGDAGRVVGVGLEPVVGMGRPVPADRIGTLPAGSRPSPPAPGGVDRPGDDGRPLVGVGGRVGHGAMILARVFVR
jgi:hypothetical protein